MAVRIVDWAFRSRETGKLTVAQLPNASLVLFAACRLVQAIATPHGSVATDFRWAALAALAWWALDEIFRGVNPFRRLLGAAVLGALFL